MIQVVSYKLANYFLEHQWIEKSDYEWCLYVVQKKLLQICFLLILSICSIMSGQYVNVLIFMLTAYFLRSRIGGWHAPYNWLCIVLTIAITLLVLFVLGPMFLGMNFYAVWGLDFLLMLVAAFTKPVYPLQLHFSEDVVEGNIIRKNIVLAWILFVQIVSFVFGMQQVLIFSFYGVLMSILLVFIERIKQKVCGG